MSQAAPPQVSSVPREGFQRDPKSQLGQDVSICNMSVEQANREATGALIPTQRGSLGGHLFHRFFFGPLKNGCIKSCSPSILGLF